MNIKSIDEFPNEEARKIQEQLIKLDKQGVLKQQAIDNYKNKNRNGKTLLPFCISTWDYYGKTLYMEYTGLMLDENNNIIDNISINRTSKYKDKNFLWKCIECGSLWVASINDRMLYTCSCDTCRRKYKLRNIICKAPELLINALPDKPLLNKELDTKIVTTRGTSFPEQFLYCCFKQLYPNTLNRYKDEWRKYEYDIVIPEINLYIEYSSYYWHQLKLDRDRAKELNCEEHNIRFVDIYEFNKEVDTSAILVNNYITIIRVIGNKYINSLIEIVKHILNAYAEPELIDEIDFVKAIEDTDEKIHPVQYSIEHSDKYKEEMKIIKSMTKLKNHNISYSKKYEKEIESLSYDEKIELCRYYKEHEEEIERKRNFYINATDRLISEGI